MSITSTIATMRKAEIIAQLPKMNMNDLHASRSQLKELLYSKGHNPDRNKSELSDIVLTITREIHKRADAQDKVDGNDPDSQNKAALKASKELREVDNNRIAKNKLLRARSDFDESSDKIGFIEEHGNPYSKEASDFL